MSTIRDLIAQKIKAITAQDDQLHLAFENTARLSIFNSHKITPCAAHLEGKTLTGVIEAEAEITLLMSGDVSVTINMQDDGYRGPEALCYTNQDGLIAIWN